MLTLTYSADLYTVEKNYIGKAIVMSNTKELAILGLDEEVFNELSLDVIVNFYDEIKGIVSSRCTISNMRRPQSYGDAYTCTCKINSIIDVIQRRKDVYARITVGLDMHLVKSIKKFGGDKNINLESKSFPSVLKNISAGGMFFESPRRILKGACVAFYLDDLIEKGAEVIVAEILRTEILDEVGDEENESDPTYGYGCRFIDLTRSMESKLRQFVFKENQTQQLKRKKIQRDYFG